MKNRVEVKVNKKVFEQTHLTEEQIMRDLATKMVREMPFEELKKLLKFEKLDPHSEQSSIKLQDITTPEWEKQRIITMRQADTTLYSAECVLPNGVSHEDVPYGDTPQFPKDRGTKNQEG